MSLKRLVKKIPFIKKQLKSLNNSFLREEFVRDTLTKIKDNENIFRCRMWVPTLQKIL